MNIHPRTSTHGKRGGRRTGLVCSELVSPNAFPNTSSVQCRAMHPITYGTRTQGPTEQLTHVTTHRPTTHPPTPLRSRLFDVCSSRRQRRRLWRRLRSFLKKPLRAVWLSPESRLVEGMLPACPPSDLAFTPVICVSASKARAAASRGDSSP